MGGYTSKCEKKSKSLHPTLQVGLRAEIKILHFSQMGQVRVILFLLPHAQSTLAICHVRIVC
jgi:hypothetical protein